MKSVDYLSTDQFPQEASEIIKGRRISFTVFQKAIKVNADLRKQIKDIIDLGLCDYAFRVNSEIIQAARDRAEKQSAEIMMKFLNGMGNYQLLKRMVHRNRVIRTLAMRDSMEQDELLCRVRKLKVV